jgi:hypothetical protein
MICVDNTLLRTYNSSMVNRGHPEQAELAKIVKATQMNITQAKHLVNNDLVNGRSIQCWEYMTGTTWGKAFGPYKDGLTKEQTQAFDDAKKWESQASAMYNPIDDLVVGDGITLAGYSDRTAHTIIKRTKLTITLQRDTATHTNKADLKFHAGGFSAHCSNNAGQEYSYEKNENGGLTTIRRRADGEWKTAGQTSGAMRARVGRHEFYDFNF